MGWGVPVALAGTDLPTGDSIHEEHFHGVVSQGMICLDGELGMTVPVIGGGTGLQVFHDEGLLGKSLPEVIPFSEALVHMKVYPNRPDCLGLVGIARELAALLGLQLLLPEAPQPDAFSAASMPVKVLDRSLCPRYTCQVISGVRVGKSPAWLASRLLATGSRPINNVVDITNFVMKEWAQPLHAFDLQNVRQKIVVRRFKKGEELALVGRTDDLDWRKRSDACRLLSLTPNRRWRSPVSWAAISRALAMQPPACCSKPRTSSPQTYG